MNVFKGKRQKDHPLDDLFRFICNKYQLLGTNK